MPKFILTCLLNLAIVFTLISCVMSPSPPLPDEDTQSFNQQTKQGLLTPKVDVWAVLLDASGSMSDDMNGYAKIGYATNSLKRMNTYLQGMPLNSLLRDFGPYDFEDSSSVLYGLRKLDSDTFAARLTTVGTQGASDMTAGLNAMRDDLKEQTGSIALMIFSDGTDITGSAVNSALSRIVADHGERLCVYAIGIGKHGTDMSILEGLAQTAECGESLEVNQIKNPNDMEAFVTRAFFNAAGDADGDGVVDQKDQCPDTPQGWKVDQAGCALDEDGDGVADAKDRCPNTPQGWPVDQQGCPKDSDSDGIYDATDQCPGTPNGVKVNKLGCLIEKDSDADGVVDAKDRCPNTTTGAMVDASGCELDSDADGVVDSLDQCPETPRGDKVNEQGCSLPKDSDGDGVVDALDACPGTAPNTPVNERGCAAVDSDGDGIADTSDRCPGTPSGWGVDASGCPLDSDGDGVVDATDRCSGTPLGANVGSDGCWTLSALRFDSGKANLKTTGVSSLEELVNILKRNSFSKIIVSAYTDSVGGDAGNKALSLRRAQSVVDYLVENGFDADKIEAVGHGEANPIATNDTAEGRALNRRVEIDLVK